MTGRDSDPRPRRGRRPGVVGLALLTVALTSWLSAAPAAAEQGAYQVAVEAGTAVHSTGPHFSDADVVGVLPKGTQLDVRCAADGETGRTTIGGVEQDWSRWLQLSDGTWVFDGDTDTDPSAPISSCTDVPAADTSRLLCDSSTGSPDTSCDGLDPEVSRCVTAGLVKLASAPIGDPDGGTVELWYSRTCRAGWVRAVWPQSAEHFAGRGGFVDMNVSSDTAPFPTNFVANPSNLLWSPMASAQRGECLLGEVYGETANGTTFNSPQLRDCS